MDVYEVERPPDNDVSATPLAQSGIVMSGSDLAKILGVGSSSLSQSARSGWQCRGYDVSKWAIWEGERIVSYDVPADVVDRLTGPDAPDYPASAPTPPPDTARRGASPSPHSGLAVPEPPRMQSPWGAPLEAYGAGFESTGWPPGTLPLASLPAALSVEQVSAELRRVIEEMHQQAKRREEGFDRDLATLRADNDKLRGEISQLRTEHAKEIRDAERQLSKVREEAAEKRFELREKLLDAHTEARLAEGGVEESWISRLVERHGEDLAGILAGAVAAFANKAGEPTEAVTRPNPVEWPAGLPSPYSDFRNESQESGAASGPYTGPGNDDIQAEAQVETAREIAELLLNGPLESVEEGLASLRDELGPEEAIGLARAVVGELLGANPVELGGRLRPIVASQFPLVLSVPPAAAVQMARGYGIASPEAEGEWLLTLVRALQESVHPKRRATPKAKSDFLPAPSTPDPS